jgi:hypothetical protein
LIRLGAKEVKRAKEEIFMILLVAQKKALELHQDQEPQRQPLEQLLQLDTGKLKEKVEQLDQLEERQHHHQDHQEGPNGKVRKKV